MDNQVDSSNMTVGNGHWGLALGYLAAGIGVGVAVGIFLAPKTGKDTRRWIASKCLDVVDGANENIRHSRMNLGKVLERGQTRITHAIDTGRQSLGQESNARH